MEDRYICKCCGGHINRVTMKCEYCDTQYEERNADVIKIATYRNPMDTYKTSIRVSDSDLYAIEKSNGDYTKFLLEEMANALTKQLIPNMVVEVERDMYDHRTSIIHGMVRVERPIHTDDNMDALRYGLSTYIQ